MVCRGNRMKDLKLFKAEGSKLSELKTDRNRSQEVQKGPGYIELGKTRVKPEDAGFYICKSGREAVVTTFSVYGKAIIIMITCVHATEQLKGADPFLQAKGNESKL